MSTRTTNDETGQPRRAAHDFFISYTRPDERWAEWVASVLEDADHTVFIQAWDIRPGMNFVAEMQRGAIDAERTLCVLSPAYLQSKFCTAEWTAAFDQDASGERAQVLPVRIVDFDPPGLFGPIVYIDLVGKNEGAARRALLDSIERGRAKRQGTFPGTPGKTTPQSGGRSSPFPGGLPQVWTVPVPPNITSRVDERSSKRCDARWAGSTLQECRSGRRRSGAKPPEVRRHGRRGPQRGRFGLAPPTPPLVARDRQRRYS